MLRRGTLILTLFLFTHLAQAGSPALVCTDPELRAAEHELRIERHQAISAGLVNAEQLRMRTGLYTKATNLSAGALIFSTMFSFGLGKLSAQGILTLRAAFFSAIKSGNVFKILNTLLGMGAEAEIITPVSRGLVMAQGIDNYQLLFSKGNMIHSIFRRTGQEMSPTMKLIEVLHPAQLPDDDGIRTTLDVRTRIEERMRGLERLTSIFKTDLNANMAKYRDESLKRRILNAFMSGTPDMQDAEAEMNSTVIQGEINDLEAGYVTTMLGLLVNSCKEMNAAAASN